MTLPTYMSLFMCEKPRNNTEKNEREFVPSESYKLL